MDDELYDALDRTIGVDAMVKILVHGVDENVRKMCNDYLVKRLEKDQEKIKLLEINLK